MINRDIHIVFGEFAKRLFIQSKKIDLDSILLIFLDDCLNLGPNCTREFQRPARIIAYTLCTIDFNVGDSYLNYRMKQLAFMKKVEIRGKLKQMRDYEVRLL